MEPSSFWFIGLAVAFGTLSGIALWRSRASATRDPHADPKPAPSAGPVSDTDLLRLIHEGRVIEAIKAYREQTGASLLEAKQAIDRLRAGK